MSCINKTWHTSLPGNNYSKWWYLQMDVWNKFRMEFNDSDIRLKTSTHELVRENKGKIIVVRSVYSLGLPSWWYVCVDIGKSALTADTNPSRHSLILRPNDTVWSMTLILIMLALFLLTLLYLLWKYIFALSNMYAFIF